MDDLISRQAAIEALGERPMVWVGSDYELGARNQYDADVVALETVPSAQPKRKKGRWINGGRIIRCNRCQIGYATVKGMKSALTYKFCPNCGSYNEGDADEDR